MRHRLAALERAEDAKLRERERERERQRRTVRWLSWGLAWAVPLIALIVGISLTSAGTIERVNDWGDGVIDVTLFVVWPAGLVLLGAGVLGVIAAAIATAILTTDR